MPIVSTNLLTAAQVADRLDVSKRYVLKLITDGRIKAEKIGLQYLIHPRDLAKLKRRPAGRPKAR